MLSDADNRVLAHLRNGRSGTVSAIGAACFALAGKPKRFGSLPAAAHLARMEERRLIRRVGRRYVLEPEAGTAQLFPEMDA